MPGPGQPESFHARQRRIRRELRETSHDERTAQLTAAEAQVAELSGVRRALGHELSRARRTKAELVAEIEARDARIAELEGELAKRPPVDQEEDSSAKKTKSSPKGGGEG